MTPADQQRLRAHGIVVFHDRIIFRAQPPITAKQRASIETRTSGPIPPGLMALWQASFGGTIDYDLPVRFREGVAHFSFSELFYPGSGAVCLKTPPRAFTSHASKTLVRAATSA